LPKNISITKATIGVYNLKSYWTSLEQYLKDNDVQLHKITKSWSENNNPYLTNWNNYGNAIEPTPLGSKLWKVGTTNIWFEFDVTSVVKGYFATPSSNYGFMLCNYIGYAFTNYEGSLLQFTTSEYSGASVRPKLTIEYTTGTDIKMQNTGNLWKPGHYTVRITNIKGQPLAEFKTEDMTQIQRAASEMPAGIKLVQIRLGNIQIVQKMVIR